jgi:hypothetical protein
LWVSRSLFGRMRRGFACGNLGVGVVGGQPNHDNRSAARKVLAVAMRVGRSLDGGSKNIIASGVGCFRIGGRKLLVPVALSECIGDFALVEN